MGYGYQFEDVKVGSEFYFSYSYYAIQSDHKRSESYDEALRNILIYEESNDITEHFDRYKIIQKYKFFDSNYLDPVNRKLVPFRERREHVLVKNLRTGEVTQLSDYEIDHFYYFCWVTLDNYRYN